MSGELLRVPPGLLGRYVGPAASFPTNPCCSFKVEDEGLVSSPLVAWACIRLDRLRQGYRFIRLLDAHGNVVRGKILVKISKAMR